MKKIIILISVILIFGSSCFVTAAEISAKAAVVINGDTGEILYSKNCDEHLPMASTTKIMTALLLCEMGGDLSREIVTTKEMVTVEGSSMGLLEGDTVSLHDLLYGMMLASGNDAANTTAIALCGSVDAFVERMNQRAAQMGLLNTHFVTPSGLDADTHYTTAYELALIAREAMKNEAFRSAVSSKSATLNYGNPPYRRTLTNHNKLLKLYDDVVGVKTGFTKKSGRCLVSAAERDGKFVIAVTLNDGNDWADHRTLLDIGLASVQITEYSLPNPTLEFSVVGGNSDAFAEQIEGVTFSMSSSEQISSAVYGTPFLYAPVKKGDTVATVKYYSGDRLISIADVKSSYDVECKKVNFCSLLFEQLKYMIGSLT